MLVYLAYFVLRGSVQNDEQRARLSAVYNIFAFAAMIPLAGSAYTYAYATLGELFAWIIGWDLTLEYAMGASTVSSGWSNHFIELLNIFNIKLPLWLAYDHWTGLRTAENVIARQMAQARLFDTTAGNRAIGDDHHLDGIGTRVAAIAQG